MNGLVEYSIKEGLEQIETQLRTMCLEYANTIDVSELVMSGYTIEKRGYNKTTEYVLLMHCEPVAHFYETTKMDYDSEEVRATITIQISDIKRWER